MNYFLVKKNEIQPLVVHKIIMRSIPNNPRMPVCKKTRNKKTTRIIPETTIRMKARFSDFNQIFLDIIDNPKETEKNKKI